MRNAWTALCILVAHTYFYTTAAFQHPRVPKKRLFSFSRHLFHSLKDEVASLEKKVEYSADNSVDMNRILKALDESGQPSSTTLIDDLLFDNEDVSVRASVSRWHIAAAAATMAAAFSYVTFQSSYLSLFLMVFAFFAAVADNDTISGAMARILGRSTIRSVQASQPRVRALVRAVLTGEEEIALLRDRIHDLEVETDSLRQWKQRRQKIDAGLSQYRVAELKELARVNGLSVGGTKGDLYSRLLDDEIIGMD